MRAAGRPALWIPYRRKQHIRLAIAALTGRVAQAREVYRAAFALACLIKPLLQVIEHGYGRCGVEVERGRYQRRLRTLVSSAWS